MKVSQLTWQNNWQLDYDDVGEVASKFKEGVEALVAVRNACANEGAGILEHVNCGKILGGAVVGYFQYLKDAHGTAGGCIVLLQKAYDTMKVAGQANGDRFPGIIDSYNAMEMDGEFKLGNRVNADDIQWLVNEIGSGKTPPVIEAAVSSILAIKGASCIDMPDDVKNLFDELAQALNETVEAMKQVRSNLQQSAQAVQGELAKATEAVNANDAGINKALDVDGDKEKAMRNTSATTK